MTAHIWDELCRIAPDGFTLHGTGPAVAALHTSGVSDLTYEATGTVTLDVTDRRTGEAWTLRPAVTVRFHVKDALTYRDGVLSLRSNRDTYLMERAAVVRVSGLNELPVPYATLLAAEEWLYRSSFGLNEETDRHRFIYVSVPDCLLLPDRCSEHATIHGKGTS